MRLPTLKPMEVIRALTKLGFERARQSGSHIVMVNKISGKLIPIPMHNKDMKRGLLRNIVKQTGLRVKDFVELL